jgi:class 3 adenylate cyclase
MNKKNLRVILIIWDIAGIILIAFSVFMMFETVIKKMLIDSKVNEYFEIINNIQVEYKNSTDFLNAKPNLPYKESITEILNYLKLSALKKSKFENNLVMILSRDASLEYLAGLRNNRNLALKKDDIDYKNFYLSAAKIPLKISIKDYKLLESKLDKNDIKHIEYFYKISEKSKSYMLQGYPEMDELESLRLIFSNEKNINYPKYVNFSYLGKKYIGFADFLQVGINRNLDKNNIEKFYPLFVVADLNKDFFYLINRVRNIFLIILGLIFITISAIKLYNAIVVSREIKEINTSIKSEAEAIEKKGEIGTALKELNLLFKETSYLYDSYSTLSGKLVFLGDIISGIADKELFVAALRNDKSILDPHEVNMAVLFLDVKGFTTISETHKEKAMGIINYIWDAIESIIYKYNGKINKYFGDAALIIFPEKKKDNKEKAALNAILSAVSILETVDAIKEKLKIEFNFRIGIDYGSVVYGKTGSARNFELGVIGDTVNTASRLENLNKQYNTNILITDAALKNSGFKPEKNCQLRDEPVMEGSFYLVDRVRPKGKKEAKEIYTVLLNAEKQRKFLGSENIYPVELFDFYSEFLQEFFSNIKYWQNSNKKEGIKKWTSMARRIGKFFHENKFPIAEIFINKLLSYEEVLKYQKDPASWLKQDEIQIKIPDDDWINYGTIELSK